jgi:hypothetical protein
MSVATSGACRRRRLEMNWTERNVRWSQLAKVMSLTSMLGIAVVAHYSPADAQPAVAPITKSQIRGCWRKTYDPPPPNNPAAGQFPPFAEVCFRARGRVDGIIGERTGEANEIEASWKLRNRNLVIDTEGCGIRLGDGKIVVSGCSYAGVWGLQCKEPSKIHDCWKKE